MLKYINDPEGVSNLIQKLEPQLAQLVEEIRLTVLGADVSVGEQIKWNSPSFFYTGEMKAFDPKDYKRDIVVINIRKNEALLVFPTGIVIDDPTGLLEGNYPDGRKLARFKSLDDLRTKKDDLRAAIKNWLEKVEKPQIVSMGQTGAKGLSYQSLEPASNMYDLTAGGFRLIGLQLDRKTYNANGQSGRDCGFLWQKFESEDSYSRISPKLGDEIYAVYFDYEGDHTQPYSYFIGCRVDSSADIPEGMSSIYITEGPYTHLTAEGKMPDCVAKKWKEIWESDMERRYTFDFEIYGEKSRDWNNAAVEILISRNPH